MKYKVTAAGTVFIDGDSTWYVRREDRPGIIATFHLTIPEAHALQALLFIVSRDALESSPPA